MPPYVGVSLYTWTSVIGVVLAGITLGNYLGGWIADRYASLRLLGSLLLLAGLASFGILAVDALGGRLPGSWPIVFYYRRDAPNLQGGEKGGIMTCWSYEFNCRGM